MDGNRNPGLIAVTAGVGFAVLFALLGVTAVLDGKIAFGLAVVSLAVAAMVYVFYSRGNAVTKTGYASLILLIAIGLIIPFMIVAQTQVQANAQAAQYDLTLQRGAAIYGQYCAVLSRLSRPGSQRPEAEQQPRCREADRRGPDPHHLRRHRQSEQSRRTADARLARQIRRLTDTDDINYLVDVDSLI